jgi:hypothetical protein
MVDKPTEDDFLLLCAEFGLNDYRRRGLLWHALCRARAIGSMQVCISLRQLVSLPHPVLRRPMTLGEVHQAVKFYQENSRKDMEQWHDLPEQYSTFEQPTQEGAGNGTGEAPAVPNGNDVAAQETGSAEAGECGGCDDVG